MGCGPTSVPPGCKKWPSPAVFLGVKAPFAWISSALLFAAVLLVPVEALGAQKNSQNRTKKGGAAELPVVKKVGKGMITVGKKRYEVSDTARIMVNGKPAELSDIKPGMQASVAGGVSKYGRTSADTIYKASRISARADNNLEKKRKAFNKKQAEAARKANQRNRRNQRRR